ncbi:MAG: TIGR01777 family oxidoreductase [Desulfatiglandaceae bacterium]
MNIFITGGTGFVGSRLTEHLTALGHGVTVLTRKPPSGQPSTGISYVTGDPASGGPWQQAAADHEALINLAGASIFKRWSDDYKKVILQSRLDTTRNLTEAAGRTGSSVKVMLSASAVGYYGSRGDQELTEDDEPGDDFLASVCRHWEEAAASAENFGVRVVLCRLGIVLGRDGAALSKMLPLYKHRLGARLGTGENWFSWVHIDDLAKAFGNLLEDEEIHGPVNITAPQPVRFGQFHRALSAAVDKTQIVPPVPSFLVRLVLGDFGRVLTEGQRVYPRVLLQQKFRFAFPELQPALKNLVGIS